MSDSNFGANLTNSTEYKKRYICHGLTTDMINTMKRHYLFRAIVGSVIAMTISSSGKEDKTERFPEGTSMIKMMDEDNGAPQYKKAVKLSTSFSLIY